MTEQWMSHGGAWHWRMASRHHRSGGSNDSEETISVEAVAKEAKAKTVGGAEAVEEDGVMEVYRQRATLTS